MKVREVPLLLSKSGNALVRPMQSCTYKYIYIYIYMYTVFYHCYYIIISANDRSLLMCKYIYIYIYVYEFLQLGQNNGGK